ncbi:MAG: alpha/beta hydrolase [Myxococcales bacterium FL481]|nr:MAG: alpha/beta hydrolase [Myxococcales bacterium FL481]
MRSLVARGCLRGLFIGALLSGCGPAAADPTGASQLELEPCRVVGVGRPAQCGRLAVPENPEQPQGRQVSLKIVVVPATSRSPVSDPMYLLAGGPGQAAIEVFPPEIAAFREVNKRRDLVLVDMRGTGSSSPLLCDGVSDAHGDRILADADPNDAVECLAAIEADTRQYTTRHAVRDLEAVRGALGHGPINLLGVSYGTRLALEYTRYHPDHVRSLVLDGVAPPQMALPESFAVDAQAAFEALVARCHASPDCKAAFPDIAGDLRTMQQLLAAGPTTLTVPDPRTGALRSIEVSPRAVVSAVRASLYATALVAMLPLALHRAAHGQLPRALAQFSVLAQSTVTSMNGQLLASVVCTEDLPRIDAQRLATASADSFLGMTTYDVFAETCRVWPRGPLPEHAGRPVHSEAPALLLSGALDPVTPPRWAQLAQQTLPRARHLVVDQVAHGTFRQGCMPDLIAEFVDSLEPDAVDASCLDDIEPAEFFIDFAGPSHR